MAQMAGEMEGGGATTKPFSQKAHVAEARPK
jgi:hypothetical protein